MQSALRQQVLVAAVAAFVFFFRLGAVGLFDEDEPRNAGCAEEMFERGDWIVPVFNGYLRSAKPILLYWLTLTAYTVLGVNEFSARFWSALLAVGTTLSVYHLGRSLYNQRVGLLASLVLATTFMFDVEARAATPDSTLVCCTTLSLTIFVRASRGRSGWLGHAPPADGFRGDSIVTALQTAGWRDYLPKSKLAWIGMYAAMGLAVLAKGPVGLVLPIGVLGLFLLTLDPLAGPSFSTAMPQRSRVHRAWELARRLAARFAPSRLLSVAWNLRPCTALAVVGLVALPWYVAVSIRTGGEWLTSFLLNENLGRFVQPLEKHYGSFFYHPAVLFVAFFPWSVWFGFAGWDWWRRRRQGSLGLASDQFIACWFGLYLVFFSLANTKLPSYLVPAYPALALALARFFDRWIDQPQLAIGRLRNSALVALVLAGLGCAIVTPLVFARLVPGGEPYAGLVGLIPLAGGLVAWRYSHRLAIGRSVAALVVTAVLLSTTVFGFSLVRIARHQTSQAFVETAEATLAPKPCWLTYGTLDPSLAFYAHSNVRVFNDQQFEQFVQYVISQPNPAVVVREDVVPAFRARLPADFHELDRKPRFLRRGELFLFGRVPSTARAADTSAAPR